MNYFMDKRKVVFVGVLLLATFLLAAFSQPDKDGCPTAVQKGEGLIQIPAGELVGRVEVQIVRCAGLNVQTTAGMMLEAPVVVNGIVHHDVLVLTVHLLDAQPGPVNVSVWWRVD